MARRHTIGRLASAVRYRAALTTAAAICGLLVVSPSASAAQQRYSYRVDDATYGNVGTYGYLVDKTGDTAVITTEAHIKVTVLGVTMYRQEVSRRERWSGGRLVEFHGVTTENGTPVEIHGRADGDRFVIKSPTGETTAPGTIRPISPWSAGTPATAMFMPDTGRITTVRVSDAGDAAITTDGATSQAHRYRIDTAEGQEHYEVWMSRDGTPLKFSLKDGDSDATFTLVK